MSSYEYVVFQAYHESIFQQKYLSYCHYFDASSSTLLSSALNTSRQQQSIHNHQQTQTDGKRSTIYTNTNDPVAVSIGGINQKWNTNGINCLKWLPKIIPFDKSNTGFVLYYDDADADADADDTSDNMKGTKTMYELLPMRYVLPTTISTTISNTTKKDYNVHIGLYFHNIRQMYYNVIYIHRLVWDVEYWVNGNSFCSKNLSI
jgi:hypothetical protein